MFNDWLIHKMTGILAVEPSNGSTTGLFSLKRSWDPPLPDAADCAPICSLKGMRLQAGTVTAQWEQTATTRNTIVGGDAQLGCIGVGLSGQTRLCSAQFLAA